MFDLVAPRFAAARQDLSSGNWQVTGEEAAVSRLLLPQLDRTIHLCDEDVSDSSERDLRREVLADALAALVVSVMEREGRLVSLLVYSSAALAPTFPRLDACGEDSEEHVVADVHQVLADLQQTLQVIVEHQQPRDHDALPTGHVWSPVGPGPRS